MHGKDEKLLIQKHNTARFFVENRQLALVLLVAVFIWGAASYFRMPQRKDPDIPLRVAAVTCSWPGAAADKVEDLVTRRLEEKIAENDKVDRIESTTRQSVSMGRPSSRMNPALSQRGCAPHMARSLTVPLMASEPMSPPGKKSGCTT